jgi:hypothetical protein
MTWIAFCGDLRAVDTLSKDTSQCRLADAMKSEKDIAVMKCVCFTGIHQNFFDEILTDDIGKSIWAIGLVERHGEKKKCKRLSEENIFLFIVGILPRYSQMQELDAILFSL